MNRLRKFIHLPLKEQRLFLEAWFFLALMKTAVALFPFRRIASLLGKPGAINAGEYPAHLLPPAQAVGLAVRRAATATPWTSTCLLQAFAGRLMLRRRKIPSVIFIGVLKAGDDALKAHAWLACGEVILTGEREREPYQVLSTFS